MAKLSAGILLFKHGAGGFEVFLVHPGGPFWAKKDLGAWSLPKGEYARQEDPLNAALREFEEETSFRLEPGNLLPLGELKQPSGKIVTAWALEKDVDAALVKSNLFAMEWPPKSGQRQEFPEVDRAGWFPLAEARQKLLKGQVAFLDRLMEMLRTRSK
ncbi:MAG: NUDIX domain-containing protein [Bryobacteraceae bacterium]|jgi:predicted NUDIX family NTP pyrophosphohydrolase